MRKETFVCMVVLWLISSSLVSAQDPRLIGESRFDNFKIIGCEQTYSDSFLPYDTLILENAEGVPGDTEVFVTISLTNTIPVAGFRLMFTYDTLVLTPHTYLDIWECGPDTACTSLGVFAEKTERTEPLNWSYWQGGCRHWHVDTTLFLGGIIVAPNLQPGRGPIVRFEFRVKPDAIPGDTTYLKFVLIDPGDGYGNFLVDSLGLFVLIPQLRDGCFFIRPCQCGDPNDDNTVDIGDIIYLINYLFIEGSPPVNPECADVNHDSEVDIADIIHLINYLFISGPEPDCWE
jgi:hypothetical protein